jgi:hypothetical protein
MFCSYSRSSFRILTKEFRILSAMLRTARDCSELMRRMSPSASSKISNSRSSRPLPYIKRSTFEICHSIDLTDYLDQLTSQTVVVLVVNKDVSFHLLAYFYRLQFLLNLNRTSNLFPSISLYNHELGYIELVYTKLPARILTKYGQNLPKPKLCHSLALEYRSFRHLGKSLNTMTARFAASCKTF